MDKKLRSSVIKKLLDQWGWDGSVGEARFLENLLILC